MTNLQNKMTVTAISFNNFLILFGYEIVKACLHPTLWYGVTLHLVGTMI